MSASGNADLREEIRRLHHEKDAAYRDAWKKRGEVISILANIARKIDRLAYILDDGPVTADESPRDTAIDLMVYSLKYQTYLADLDPVVAKKLFVGSDLSRPYSDGPRGFEHLLSQVDMSQVDMAGGDTQRMTLADAVGFVLRRFGELEACFAGLTTAAPVHTRLTCAQKLTDAVVCLLATFR
ncbi:MAG: hypothetical protein ACRDQ4_19945 [Pseudonocardiaceae bacterium]